MPRIGYDISNSLERSFDNKDSILSDSLEKNMLEILDGLVINYGSRSLFDKNIFTKISGNSEPETTLKVAFNSQAIAAFKGSQCYWEVFNILRKNTPWRTNKINCVIKCVANVLCFDIDRYLDKSIDWIFVKGGTVFCQADTLKIDDFFVLKDCIDLEEWYSYSGGKAIDWVSAIKYCNYKSLEEGLSKYYLIDDFGVSCSKDSDGYRLPTLNELIYLASGGQKHISEDCVSNFEKKYDERLDFDTVELFYDTSDVFGNTHLIFSKTPNLVNKLFNISLNKNTSFELNDNISTNRLTHFSGVKSRFQQLEYSDYCENNIGKSDATSNSANYQDCTSVLPVLGKFFGRVNFSNNLTNKHKITFRLARNKV